MITDLKDYKNYIIYKSYFDINNKLNEGLIKTFNPDFVYRKIKKELRLHNNNANIYIDNEIQKIKNYSEYNFPMEICFKEKVSFQTLLKFETLFNTLGYFVSSYFIDDKKYNKDLFLEEYIITDSNNIVIIIEAKFDVSINLIDEYIYHITELKNLDKIKKIGLIPKSKNKLSNHLERIYFMLDDNKNNLITQFNNLSLQLYPNVDINEDIIVLKINTKHLKNVKFYQDPNFTDGVYTLNNISQKIIEFI